MKEIIITLENGETVQVEEGTTLKELIKKINKSSETPIVAAQVNNELKELSYAFIKPSKVKFFDLSTEIGMGIYVRSLSFVFIRATREIIPNCSSVSVEHSLAKGLYCEIKGKALTFDIVKKIEERMKEIISADEPFEKRKVTKEEAVEIFKKDGQTDKVRILKYLTKPKGDIYKLGWLHDFYYGYLVPSTGCLKHFSLQFHLPGVIIRYPTLEKPNQLPPYIPQAKLAAIFYEAERWGEIMEVDTIAALNDLVANNKLATIIRVAEALHEKKVANIADQIYNHKDRGNVILIAGPSSSGKTTFAQRLMVQLMVNGLKPVSISVDDYFVNREDTPIDHKGESDFEALEAIDLELLNDHLSKLIQGEEIEIPTFNFQAGHKEYLGKKLQIRPDQPIIIEGIHGLNEKLTYSIPKEHKYKIYISALTQLNIDHHNRVPTTDARKIRRMVRDNQFRGTDALRTIRLWPSVRRGEDKNIFPFQEDADIMFNSALIYEMAVLKPYAEKLLKAIGPEYEEYLEAQRLLRLLSYVLPAGCEEIPFNSILREFIGDSCFVH
ncbi:MAG: ATPase AAA [Peptococcaceae bacterium BICA1-8]|nr:MAG: ATPase AAA [Peptococcaceae bacterium BICA1-8]